jgi:hypothetical protein
VRLEVLAETDPSANACTADACTADACTADACAHTCTDAKAGRVWSYGDVRCGWHG